MKYLRLIAVLLVVAVLVAAVLFTRGALRVATGYSAKQLCSAVFVGGLPEAFALERDILPRMAILGPARDLLSVEADRERGLARAEILGVSAQAVHRLATGCSLHGKGPGEGPREVVSPSAVAPVPALLQGAFDDAFAEPAGEGRNTLALLVALDGALVAERYTVPVHSATPMQGWSMNKSLMATWVGMAAERGVLDPTQRALQLVQDLPEAKATQIGIDSRLTLLHLLQMESGLAFEEKYGPGSDVTKMLYEARAMWRVPVKVGHDVAPGQRFAYSSGDTVLASYLWQSALGEPYQQWLQREFTDPLGLQTLVAEPDASGVQVGSSYAYLTARDWLRVGQLWLDAWHGRSDLLSQSWLRASVEARKSDGQGRYGRGFWLNTDGVAFPGLPDNLFYAGGNAGQSVVVIPEWDMVVVRLGLSEPGVATGLGDFLQRIASLRDELRSVSAPLPEEAGSQR